MFRVKLKALMEEKSYGKTPITLTEVSNEIGVSRKTLKRFCDEQNYNVGLNVLDKLCTYFSCQPNDIIEFVDE